MTSIEQNSEQAITAMLGMHNIAVVGLSSKEDRPSHAVAAYLQAHGYQIIPIHPNEKEVLGEKAYPNLAAVPADVQIDVVDVFRRAEDTPEIVQQAAERGAKGVWLQLEIESDAAAQVAQTAGLLFVQNHCMKIEHHKHQVR